MSSVDSGHGDSLRNFFQTTIPDLEEFYHLNDSHLNSTRIHDLQSLEKGNIKKKDRKEDLELSQLTWLKLIIESDDPYGEKLIKIMLQDLKKTLGPVNYLQFVEEKLPKNCFPQIDINSDNKPHIELIYKSDSNDKPPFTTLEHHELTNSIVRKLASFARKTMPNKQIALNSRRINPERNCKSLTKYVK